MTKILIILACLLFSLTNKDDKEIFRSQTRDFIKKLDNNYKKFNPSHCYFIQYYQKTLDESSKCDWKEKYSLKSKFKINDSTSIHLHLAFYHFATEDALKVAKDSLLNCFPLYCNKIDIHNNQYTIDFKNKKHKSSFTIPAIYIINKNSIITCHTHNGQIANKFYETVKTEIYNTFKTENSLVIYATDTSSLIIQNDWH